MIVKTVSIVLGCRKNFVITSLKRKARVATSMYPMERHAFNVRRFGTSLGPGEALDNKFGYRLELPH